MPNVNAVAIHTLHLGPNIKGRDSVAKAGSVVELTDKEFEEFEQMGAVKAAVVDEAPVSEKQLSKKEQAAAKKAQEEADAAAKKAQEEADAAAKKALAEGGNSDDNLL